jgi:hypothetical protein
MWSHLMRGSLEADPEIILFEGYLIQGRYYAYPLPLPAIIRGIFSIFELKNYPIPSFLLASLVFALSILWLMINIAKLASRNENYGWVFAWFPLFILPILTLFISIKIYWEAAIWGLAMFALAMGAFSNFQIKNSYSNRVLVLITISILLFTRPTYTVTAISIFGAMVFIDLFQRDHFKPKGLDARIKLLVSYSIFILALVLLGCFNYAKWGSPIEFMPLQFNLSYIGSENGFRAKMAVIESTFNLKRIPEAIDYYFGVTKFNFSASSPYLISGKPMIPFNLAYFDYRELYYSLTLTFPLFFIFSAFGLKAYIKKRKEWSKNVGILLLISVIPGSLLLLLMILASRYRAEFYLFMIISGVIFLSQHAPLFSPRKNILLAFISFIFSLVLILNNVFVERKSFFDCQPGVIPRVLNDFNKCPPLDLPSLSIQNPIDFSSSGLGKYYLVHGWSSAEEWGVWSTGDKSELRVPVQSNLGEDVKEITVFYKPFISEKGVGPIKEVVINGVKLDMAQINNKVGAINIPFVREKDFNEELIIVLKYSNPISPAEMGMSPDDRKLAIGLLRMQLK